MLRLAIPEALIQLKEPSFLQLAVAFRIKSSLDWGHFSTLCSDYMEINQQKKMNQKNKRKRPLMDRFEISEGAVRHKTAELI